MSKTKQTSKLTTSLSPSNDELNEVQIEIRAAELASDAGTIEVRWGQCPEIASTSEGWGWEDHRLGRDWDDDEPAWSDWSSGWLARQIVTHDAEHPVEPITEPAQQVTFDASRAEQVDLPFPAADMPTVIEQTRHDVAASVARHAEIESMSVDRGAIARAELDELDASADRQIPPYETEDVTMRASENRQAEQGVEVEIRTGCNYSVSIDECEHCLTTRYGDEP